MKSIAAVSVILGFLVAATTSCSMTSKATNFNGLSTPEGKPIAHMSTSNIAIHFVGSKPLVGDATLETTTADFTLAAKQANATKVDIVQSKVSAWWFILPPFSFILTPVFSNVAGDVLP